MTNNFLIKQRVIFFRAWVIGAIFTKHTPSSIPKRKLISIQEFRFTNEQIYKNFLDNINDYSKPWTYEGEPRNWFVQYFQEGDFLKRQLPLCKHAQDLKLL